jgi:hypothetical protein
MTASKPSTAPRTHGDSDPVPPEALLAPDPELHLAWADMVAWHEAHPCTCTDEEEGCDGCR